MSVLKLKPSCKNYIWGGQRLIKEFGIISSKKTLAEAWMLSCHPDNPSIIAENGKTLEEYIKGSDNKILGTNYRQAGNFPILIKLIDAKENLSVQVHPTDEYALKHENQLGKSEMWYVLDAHENSIVYCGFKQKISKEEFVARITDNSLLEVLNAIRVKKGDVIFIPAGTIHAIGKGILIAEIQENSNVTYRVYDYNRGRQLHLEQALAVTNLTAYEYHLENYSHLVTCKYFVVDKLNLDGKFISQVQGFIDEKTFVNVLILEGIGEISCGTEILSYHKGDSFFLPANSGNWRIRGRCNALLTTIPEN